MTPKADELVRKSFSVMDYFKKKPESLSNHMFEQCKELANQVWKKQQTRGVVAYKSK